MKLFLSLFTAFIVALAALPTELPEPGELALFLEEDDFEDYLDTWLENEQRKLFYVSSRSEGHIGCTIRVNGDLGEPQPLYLQNGSYILPTGNTGLIQLNAGEEVYIACTGNGNTIVHPNIPTSVSAGVRTATCVSNTLVSGAGWLNGLSEFVELTCSSHASYVAEATTEKCFNDNLVIRVGFNVDNIFYPQYWSCFDQNRLEVIYVWYEQNAYNSVYQTSIARPSWLEGSFYPGVTINSLYTQAQQKLKIASYVGDELADKYIAGNNYLARGHLSAKTDHVFATGQRSTFYFINAAPEWQPINAGNWNWLEQNLRARIGEANYSTIIYTGTFGVSQLRNQNGSLVDIYLHHDDNNNPQLPVPLYYYKMVYDPELLLGTAFVTINNPYYTEEEVDALTFCTDRCRNNDAFNWLRWQPDRIDIGYSFCCDVDDFRRTVPHLPSFSVNGLLS